MHLITSHQSPGTGITEDRARRYKDIDKMDNAVHTRFVLGQFGKFRVVNRGNTLDVQGSEGIS